MCLGLYGWVDFVCLCGMVVWVVARGWVDWFWVADSKVCWGVELLLAFACIVGLFVFAACGF